MATNRLGMRRAVSEIRRAPRVWESLTTAQDPRAALERLRAFQARPSRTYEPTNVELVSRGAARQPQARTVPQQSGPTHSTAKVEQQQEGPVDGSQPRYPGLYGTATCTKVDRMVTSYDFTIHGYQQARSLPHGTRVTGDYFEAGGQLFRLEACVSGDSLHNRNHVSLFVTTPSACDTRRFEIRVLVLDHSEQSVHLLGQPNWAMEFSHNTQKTTRLGAKGGVVAGYSRFAEASTLEDNRYSSRFVVKDRLQIRVTVEVCAAAEEEPLLIRAAACCFDKTRYCAGAYIRLWLYLLHAMLHLLCTAANAYMRALLYVWGLATSCTSAIISPMATLLLTADSGIMSLLRAATAAELSNTANAASSGSSSSSGSSAGATTSTASPSGTNDSCGSGSTGRDCTSDGSSSGSSGSSDSSTEAAEQLPGMAAARLKRCQLSPVAELVEEYESAGSSTASSPSSSSGSSVYGSCASDSDSSSSSSTSKGTDWDLFIRAPYTSRQQQEQQEQQKQQGRHTNLQQQGLEDMIARFEQEKQMCEAMCAIGQWLLHLLCIAAWHAPVAVAYALTWQLPLAVVRVAVRVLMWQLKAGAAVAALQGMIATRLSVFITG